MPCLVGCTPVTMDVWLGRVIDSAVVRAQNVNVPRASMACMTGVSPRSSRSGRHPSMLMISTWSMAGTGRSRVRSGSVVLPPAVASYVRAVLPAGSVDGRVVTARAGVGWSSG